MKTSTSIIIAGALVAAAIYLGMAKMVPIPSVKECVQVRKASRTEGLKDRYNVSPSPNCFYHWLSPISKETPQ